jgi:hypothetical protein
VKFLSWDAHDALVVLFVKHCSSSTTWHAWDSNLDVTEVQHISLGKDWAALRLQNMARQSAQLVMLNDTGGFLKVAQFALAQAEWWKDQVWRFASDSATCSVGSIRFGSLTFLLSLMADSLLSKSLLELSDTARTSVQQTNALARLSVFRSPSWLAIINWLSNWFCLVISCEMHMIYSAKEHRRMRKMKRDGIPEGKC